MEAGGPAEPLRLVRVAQAPRGGAGSSRQCCPRYPTYLRGIDVVAPGEALDRGDLNHFFNNQPTFNNATNFPVRF